MEPSAPSSSPLEPSLTPPKQPRRRLDGTYQRKTGRPSNRTKGQRNRWLASLLAAGKLEQAAAYAARYNLRHPALQQTPATPATATLAAALPTADGGEGVDRAAGRENGDKTTATGIILQCSSAAPAVAPAVAGLIRGLHDDSLPLIVASPSGEVEGKTENCQSGSISKADGQEVTVEDCGMEKGWPRRCEAWVGVRSRNKDWVDVQVTETLWGKAWARDVVVQYGSREAVRLRWVSEDGRDAEYAFMKGFAAREMPEEPDPVVLPISDPEPVIASKPDRESDQPATPDENPSAGDFMERARMQAFREYLR
jgi:hypothetical protein